MCNLLLKKKQMQQRNIKEKLFSLLKKFRANEEVRLIYKSLRISSFNDKLTLTLRYVCVNVPRVWTWNRIATRTQMFETSMSWLTRWKGWVRVIRRWTTSVFAPLPNPNSSEIKYSTQWVVTIILDRLEMAESWMFVLEVLAAHRPWDLCRRFEMFDILG